MLQLHALAVQGIYPCAGQYRNAWRNVRIQGSEHQVPEPALVPNHVRDLLDRLNSKQGSALKRAAYALWRINWIHPFAGGNGRTS
ncbi:Fic family protein [Haliangium ochraceum]|uniref:Fic family protein n=1 Tax=Haliangium ochraceum TaxID=80816 RepID=UPI003B830B8A